MVAKHRLKESGLGSLFPALQRQSSGGIGPPTKPWLSKVLPPPRVLSWQQRFNKKVSGKYPRFSPEHMLETCTLSVRITERQALVEFTGNHQPVPQKARFEGKQMEMLAQYLGAVCRAYRRGRDASYWTSLEKPIKGWDVGDPTLYSQNEISVVVRASSAARKKKDEPQNRKQTWGQQQTELSESAWRFATQNRCYREHLRDLTGNNSKGNSCGAS